MTPLTKILVGIGVVALTLLCVATYIPYPPAIDEAHSAGFSGETIVTGLNFATERRFLSWVWTALHFGLLGVLGLSGLGRHGPIAFSPGRSAIAFRRLSAWGFAI